MEKSNHLGYLLLRSTQLRFILWTFSVVVVLSVVITHIINTQRVNFDKHANEAFNGIYKQLVINDAALSSFGSLLTSVGPQNVQKTRDFTEYMRDAYPHIYMFEVLVSLDPVNKVQHETLMQKMGYKDYKLTRYVSKVDPQKKPFNRIKGVPMQFPIIFMDPYLDSIKGLMGFDMMSVRTMREPLLASLASGEPTASKPYKMQEGGRGYVLIKALNTLSDKEPVYSEGGLAVLLVIKTDAMLASVASIIPAANVKLLYGQERKLAAEAILAPVTSLPIVKIATFTEERNLDDLGQPFTLYVTKTAGLYAKDLQVLLLILMLMCMAYFIYYHSLIGKYALEVQRDAALVKLSQQHANLEVMVTKRTTELQRKSDENTRLAQQLIRVQEDQFHHIARELHDEFGQTLTAIKINAHILENAETIQGVGIYAQDITDQADALYETMRNMIQRLRPEALDMFGLKVAVEQCILAFHLHEQGVELDLNINASVDDLAEMYSIASYRIVQELVNNAVKYAQLTKLKVCLDASDGYMNIIVEDNGIGFDPLEHNEGFGLSGVDERARSLGGIVDISTAVTEGVRVNVRIPLQDC